MIRVPDIQLVLNMYRNKMVVSWVVVNSFGKCMETTKIWKQPKCPSVDEWMKQLWDTYTMEYYSAIKRRNFYPLQQHGWTWKTLR